MQMVPAVLKQINCLHEALITLNNGTASFQAQSNFVRSLLDVNSTAQIWVSMTGSVFASVESFIEFVGLNLAPTQEDQVGEQYFGNPPSSGEDNSDLIEDKSPLYHMQAFMNSLYENLFIILGFVVRTMTAEVYSIPEFSRAIHENLFSDIGRLPNFRMRALVRHFVRPYVVHCPPGEAQDNVLLPFMGYFSTHMYQRINAKWESLTERQHLEQASEAAEREEAVDEVIVLMMQREYMEVIRDLLIGTGGAGGGDDDTMNIETPNPQPNRLESLSELGEWFRRSLNHPLALFAPTPKPMSRLFVYECLDSILAHVLLRNSAPKETNGVVINSGVSPNILSDLVNNKSERSHKDMFKKLVANIIGKNVGQLFKCRATIKELPRIVPAGAAANGKSAAAAATDLAISDIAQLFN
ncbi:uncharacterized protein LOC103508697 [Diaphorina citri]|uniref:Uncharacterized protein LOC103508697 n=1 Tax=Diaphorina citri TaxID=121845 RepID=A0A3Q0IRW8_DIACI|nr:uncharacterized protein LOC103508697 [Diaphorina citri]